MGDLFADRRVSIKVLLIYIFIEATDKLSGLGLFSFIGRVDLATLRI